MKAIDILNDFIITKETELLLIKARYNILAEKYPDIDSIHSVFERDLNLAKLNYRIRLIEDDIIYLKDKVSKLEDKPKDKVDLMYERLAKRFEPTDCVSKSKIADIYQLESNKLKEDLNRGDYYDRVSCAKINAITDIVNKILSDD